MHTSIHALTTAVLCLAGSHTHAQAQEAQAQQAQAPVQAPVQAPAPVQQSAVARPPHSVAFETYAFSGTINGQSTTVVAPAVFANFALSETVSLSAAWLFAYAPSANGSPTSFQAGNPSIGASTVLKGGDLKIRAGSSLVLPFTLLTDPDDQQSALLKRAATLRGNSAFSLVAPGLLGLTPWVDVGMRQGMLRLGLDFRMPLALQLSPRRERRLDAVFQLTGSAGLDVLPNLYVGTNMQAIYVSTAAAGADPTHLALIPFVRAHGKAGFAEARLTLNLDAPLGFAFSPNGVWALGLALGTTF